MCYVRITDVMNKVELYNYSVSILACTYMHTYVGEHISYAPVWSHHAGCGVVAFTAQECQYYNPVTCTGCDNLVIDFENSEVGIIKNKFYTKCDCMNFGKPTICTQVTN